ncbi:MAG: hypothetical protein IT459_14795, partial [Planctomycetes bacterium]|nr:hypothetical protein [Planctomycetota bacterium]
MRNQLLSTAFALLAVAAPVAAQQNVVYDVEPTQSNFTWSGTTSLGNIVGNPSNAFQVDGTMLASIAPVAGFGYGAVQLVGGDAFVVPDIHGKIPNPIPFLPPLATLDVLNLHLSPTSDPFAVNSTTNAFTTMVTLTALSGTLVVTPLGGSAQTTDLTGSSSTPSAASGTLGTSLSMQTSFLSVPVNSTFPFSDSGSGVSGTITVVGTLSAQWTPPFPSPYCTAKQNSQGCTPGIGSFGFAVYSGTSPQLFLISAAFVLNNKSGLLFYGSQPASVPFQGGTLCVQPPIKRTPIQNSGGNPPPNDCSGGFSIDFNSYIASGADSALVPGRVVYAQWWYRDPGFVAPNNTGLSNA